MGVQVLVAMFLVLGWLAWSVAAEPATGSNPASPSENDGEKPTTEAEIAALIQQLDAEQFSQRKAATERLIAIGKAAIPAVTEAAMGDSLEVTSRCLEVLKNLYQSADESTKAAAKDALERVAKGSNPSAARRAQSVLNPQKPAEGPAGIPGGLIIAPPGQGGVIRAQIQAFGGKAKRVSSKVTNGVKEIDVEEFDGRKIKITEDPKQGIKVEITAKDKDGKETTEKYEAKDADELQKKHPEAYKVYKTYAESRRDVLGGQIRIHIGGGGQQMPLPQPIPPDDEEGQKPAEDSKPKADSKSKTDTKPKEHNQPKAGRKKAKNAPK
jgi:hypothetical protein